MQWWTGPAPDQLECDRDGHLIVQNRMPVRGREALHDYFVNGWVLGECLFRALADEDAFFRPPWHRLRHPMIFYYGHTAVFYINKLVRAGALEAGLNPHFERLFEMGVDEHSWDDLSQTRDDWPTLAEVRDYRRAVFDSVSRVIQGLDAEVECRVSGLDDSVLRALLMGCEHERIHLETSAVLIRELPVALLRRPAAFPALCPHNGAPPESNPWVDRAGGSVALGRGAESEDFGWDCEFGRDSVEVAAHRLSRQLVSNAEFSAFVDDGGYADDRWWSDEGRAWRDFREARRPVFWSREGGLRTLFEIIPRPASWPVEVNAHEAEAYCAWLGAQRGEPCRLPRETELAQLAQEHGCDAATDSRTLREAGVGLALAWGSAQPVQGTNGSTRAIQDARGNLWQWSVDRYRALPGQPEDPLYPEFSRPATGGTHRVLRGGSFLSSGSYADARFRNYFRPHFFQHAGFRLAADRG